MAATTVHVNISCHDGQPVEISLAGGIHRSSSSQRWLGGIRIDGIEFSGDAEVLADTFERAAHLLLSSLQGAYRAESERTAESILAMTPGIEIDGGGED